MFVAGLIVKCQIRGVRIGSAIHVKPKLEAVEVQIEVHDQGVVIPKNSVIEANQSGLIAEPFIDITPQVPIPQYQFGPLDLDCAEEGLIACHGGTVQGEQGKPEPQGQLKRGCVLCRRLLG